MEPDELIDVFAQSLLVIVLVMVLISFYYPNLGDTLFGLLPTIIEQGVFLLIIALFVVIAIRAFE